LRRADLRRVAAVSAFVAVLLLPASAEASIPSYQDRLDAKRWARDWWASEYEHGVTSCYGVRFRFRSYYADPHIRYRLAYQHGCTITFNKRINWAWAPDYGHIGEKWWRFCMVAIHEYGHLPGMPYSVPPIHSRNPNNVMVSSEGLATRAWWWPFFPGCSYDGDGVYHEE
jgi:hypothetical protein